MEHLLGNALDPPSPLGDGASSFRFTLLLRRSTTHECKLFTKVRNKKKHFQHVL
jgi:hypothetical protein